MLSAAPFMPREAVPPATKVSADDMHPIVSSIDIYGLPSFSRPATMGSQKYGPNLCRGRSEQRRYRELG